MKKTLYTLSVIAMAAAVASCGSKTKAPAEIVFEQGETVETKVANEGAPEYIRVDKPQVDLASVPVDKDGYYVLFDGTSLNGWRGYGKDNVPSRWTVEDGCIKFSGTGTGEGQTGEGGDLIFARKFKNFILELEWKVSKGGNSGIFYLAQEVKTVREDGSDLFQGQCRFGSRLCFLGILRMGRPTEHLCQGVRHIVNRSGGAAQVPDCHVHFADFAH